MTIEEIVRGESKNVEFKVKLPEDSAKYIKTIIAFANTQGGCLVIGVDDVTRRVIGVDDDSAFQITDSIANAVADSCVPQIVPNIELQTIDQRTVVLITVAPEPNRPYYLKSKGKELGTYIRLAGTSRPASPEKIKELEMEGAHISWDELACIGYKVTDKEMKKLCRDIMQYREEAGLPKRNVTSAQLVNWKLLRKQIHHSLHQMPMFCWYRIIFRIPKRSVLCLKEQRERFFLISGNLPGLFMNRLRRQ